MSFELPADTEGTVAAVRARYRALAMQLHDGAVRIRQDVQVIDGRWGGSAAPACQREVMATARLAAEAAETMHQADAALLPYQQAVAVARADIAGLDREYVEQRLSYDREKLDLEECRDSRLRRARAENVDYHWNAASAQLSDRHGAVMVTVAEAAARARARLDELGGRIDGRRVIGSSRFGARLATIHSLPMLHTQTLARQVPRIADLLSQAADGDIEAAASLRRFRAASHDAAFAAALARHLEVTGLLAIPVRMSSAMRYLRPDSAAYDATILRNRSTLTFLTSLLATATSRDTDGSRALISDLVTAGRQTLVIGPERYTGYWAVSQLLAAAPTVHFGEPFARRVGTDMLRWAGSHDSIDAPYGGVAATPAQGDAGRPMTAMDPRIAALSLFRRHPDAARDVLLEQRRDHKSNLEYLVADCRDTWSDKGAMLGEVIRQAGSGDDTQSLAVTTQTVRLTAVATMERIDVGKNENRFDYGPGIDDLSGVRVPLAGLLVRHFRDVSLAASSTRPVGSPNEISALSRRDVTHVLADVCRNDTAYGALVAASVKDVGDRLQTVPHRMPPPAQRSELQSAAGRTDPLLGQIDYVREAGQLGDAAAADDANKKMVGYVHDGLDVLQTFARVNLAVGVGATAGSLLIDRIPLPHHLQDAIGETAHEGSELDVLIRATAEDEIAHRGVEILDQPVHHDTSWCHAETGRIESPTGMSDRDYLDFQDHSVNLTNGITNNVRSAIDEGRQQAQDLINSQAGDD